MFQVEWLQSALNDPASAWMKADADGHREITFAANQTEVALQSEPEGQGESRTKGRRILFVRPLAAVFRVDPAQRLVTVSGVWRFGRRRSGGA